MAFQLSPGVQVKEIDATNVVPAVSSSIGGTVGGFYWGPVSEVTTVSSEKELADIFGQPTTANQTSFLPAAGFLQYGSALKVVRCATDGLNTASVGGGTVLIKNEADYAENFRNANNTFGTFAARYPGTLGNSISVHVAPVGLTDFSAWTYSNQFSGAPGTSEFAQNYGATSANDELHVVVVDTNGQFTGTAGSVLEVFPFLSQASNATNSDGSTNYYVEVVNAQSKYVFWADHDSNLTDAGQAITSPSDTFTGNDAAFVYNLGGGADDVVPTAGEIQLALDLFVDAESVDVNLLFGGLDTTTGTFTNSNHILSIAAQRKDCMAFVSPPTVDSVGATNTTAITTWASGLTNTSYGAADSSALYVYDKYNDVYCYIPAYGHVAGLCANTDSVADTWFSPAGSTRGSVLGVVKLALNPNSTQRDELYQARVNPLVAFAGEGIQLFGDKTLLTRPSAFDRINVRRLFIVMEKAIATAARAQLFEFNDEFTQAQFRNMVEPFLRDIKGRRGVTDFAVICDSTNNTGDVVDTNRFVADIYVKPARSINFITLNFVATRTGVDFSEIAGK
jgi:hypothetical protein